MASQAAIPPKEKGPEDAPKSGQSRKEQNHSKERAIASPIMKAME